MPRPGLPPRLKWRPESRDRAGRWYIHDGGRKISTHCGAGEDRAAEDALAEYIAGRRRRTSGPRDPADIVIADVLAAYAEDVAPRHARPNETAARLGRLLSFFGTRTLDAVTGPACRDYAAGCGTPASARRDLEDFQAAINHFRREGLCHAQVLVWKPPAGIRRERWLTRDEAAALIRTAWRHRETQRGRETKKRPWRHIARFALVALYTGTRAGPICQAAFRPEPGRGWIDLDAGVFYRRPAGTRETRKRAPPIRLPDRLLAHLRRWAALGQTYVVEFNGRPVRTIKRHFPKVAAAAGLGPDVTAHVLRHTAATWLMQNGGDRWGATGFLGMSMETLEANYGHHHPDHMRSAAEAITRRPGTGRKRDGNRGNSWERDGTGKNEMSIKTTTKAK